MAKSGSGASRGKPAPVNARSAKNGRFVTVKYAQSHPNTTVIERRP